MSRPSITAYLMGMARLAAERTTCIRRGVGCVLADSRGHVLSVAYNGVASGLGHCNEGVEVGLFSVPNRPGPEHWEDPLKFYLEKGFDLYPGMRNIHTQPVSIQKSSVPSQIAVRGVRFHHACEGHDLPPGQDSCEAVHAEQNALVQCADVLRIRTAYVTLSPCKACLKLLLNTPCQEIVFLEEHVDPMPGELWRRTGREWRSYREYES